jgi:hypothetical protein
MPFPRTYKDVGAIFFEEDYSSLFQQQQYTWRGFSKVEEEKRTF